MVEILEQDMTEAELEAEIRKQEAVIADAEAKREANRQKQMKELMAKYGPGTKYNRQIVADSLDFDEEANKWFVVQKCSVCGVEEKTFTSDLFQKDKCKEHAKEARSAKRKGKVSEAKKTALDLASAKEKLAALKAKAGITSDEDASEEE